MYGTPFINQYNPQPSLDRINSQIAELESMKKQLQQPINQPTPTNLTQNFQITPNANSNTIRYANSIEEVINDIVISDTPFFSKDMTILWVKNTKGEIKTYELNEIVQKDEKDLMIESLQIQINEMKGMIESAKSSSNDVLESTESKKPNNGKSSAKNDK